MRRVLITGGTGFVGSHAVETFLAGSWRVRALIRNPSRMTWLAGLPIETAVGTLDNVESLRAAARDCDAVVHCAGLTKALHSEDLLRINGTAVGDFAASARQAGVRRFILCSSQAASGPSADGDPVIEEDEPRPLSAYGESKLQSERLLRENAGDMEWVVLRPPSVLGPRDEQFLALFRAVVRYGVYPQFGGGAQLYSFVSVHDLARALCTAAEAERGLNDVYFVANASALNWRELSVGIGEAAGRKARSLRLNKSALAILGVVNEAFARWRGKPALLSRDKLAEIFAPGWVCSSEKIRRAWGFECQWTLEATIRDTLDAYRRANWL
jgi:nucleoside-diphosphate-sugar epimerase